MVTDCLGMPGLSLLLNWLSGLLELAGWLEMAVWSLAWLHSELAGWFAGTGCLAGNGCLELSLASQ